MRNYYLYIDENPLAIDLESALAMMTEQRRAKVLAFKHEQGRKLSAAAYMLLCKALREEYGIDEPPVFDYSEHGKPSIVGHPEIYFNLSHCRSVASCVVSSSPVRVMSSTTMSMPWFHPRPNLLASSSVYGL